MENFVRIIMDKQNKLNESLMTSVFENVDMFETEQEVSVIEIPLATTLSEEQADEYANKLANMMFENGYEDFDTLQTNPQGISIQKPVKRSCTCFVNFIQEESVS